MNTENKKLKELENKIKALRKRNIRQVKWRLTKTERKYVEQLVGEENVIPFIYNIKTKKIDNFNTIKSSIIREVHYNYKKGKKTFGKHLKKQELEELRQYGIENPEPTKFIINL